jgi:hypothetical protein
MRWAVCFPGQRRSPIRPISVGARHDQVCVGSKHGVSAPSVKIQRWGAGSTRCSATKAPLSKRRARPGYTLSFGEVVALAGDHFANIEQMRQFAANTKGGPGAAPNRVCAPMEAQQTRPEVGREGQGSAGGTLLHPGRSELVSFPESVHGRHRKGSRATSRRREEVRQRKVHDGAGGRQPGVPDEPRLGHQGGRGERSTEGFAGQGPRRRGLRGSLPDGCLLRRPRAHPGARRATGTRKSPCSSTT